MKFVSRTTVDAVLRVGSPHKVEDLINGISNAQWALELDFGAMNVDDNDVLKIANLLTSFHITALNLNANCITDIGANRLAEALKTNTSLQSFSVAYNAIGSDGAIALADAVQSHSRITNFVICGNPILQLGLDAIQRLQENKPSLSLPGFKRLSKLSSNPSVMNHSPDSHRQK